MRYCANDSIPFDGPLLDIFCIVVQWQWVVVSVAGLVSIPLYFLVLRLLFKLRSTLNFVSPFYTLLFSQGILDVGAFLTYFFFCDLRHMLKGVYWYTRESYLPSFGYACEHIFLVGRILGVSLLALQRIASVTFPNSMMNYAFNGFPRALLIGSHWTLPILSCVPVLTQFHTYDDEEKMNLVVPLMDFSINALSVAVLSLVALVVVSFCFIRILIQITVDLATGSQSRRARRELSATFILAGMLAGFYLCTIFHVLQYFFVSTREKEKIDQIYAIRLFYPTMNAIFSLITPWLICLCNSEVGKMVMYSKNDLEAYKRKNLANTV
ncbi:unnamed protein product, partial [Mesorhabditis belari]|uniref:G-protein coupled receptors family 1 profile domain-containing protein n=1 Tax=Mesorhabditis belari TaxID=2138241 RepID=A0AAF3EA12_9BILA